MFTKISGLQPASLPKNPKIRSVFQFLSIFSAFQEQITYFLDVSSNSEIYFVRLDSKIVRLSSPDHGFASRVGRSGFLLFW